jgi:hypothetical protein
VIGGWVSFGIWLILRGYENSEAVASGKMGVERKYKRADSASELLSVKPEIKGCDAVFFDAAKGFRSCMAWIARRFAEAGIAWWHLVCR